MFDRADILRALHALDNLFADPDRHTTRAIARDIDGVPCACDDPNAYSFCFIGGVGHVTGDIPVPMREVIDALTETCQQQDETSLSGISEFGRTIEDNGVRLTGYPAVRAIIRQTIARLSA